MPHLQGNLAQWLHPYGATLCLFFLPFLVYWDVIWKGGWVSDDCAFSGPEAKPIATYEGNLQQPFSWGTVVKWLRFHIAKQPTTDVDWKVKNQPAYRSSPKAHHRLNLWWHGGVLVAAYTFLSHLFDPTIVLASLILFGVHPIGTQVIAWVSGCNYLFGAFFMLMALQVTLLPNPSHALGWLGRFILFGVFQWAAGESLFQMAGILLILVYLKAWPFLIIAGLLAVYQGFHTFREAITLRKRTFKEQQMEASTKIHWRKVFVIAKVFYYNFKLSLFPKRLGLYSDFFYHYPLPQTETEDRWFWAGLGVGLVSLLLVVFAPAPINFGLLWFIAFIGIFCGLVIANQMVVDRYVWLPTLGICLSFTAVLAWLQWWPLYWVLVGLLLMRTWMHLPAYYDEERFYLSNIYNFPSSEIAYGNLGVNYLNQGWVGSAIEAWTRSTMINGDYDVPWYNLSSIFKSRGPINPNFIPRFFQLLPPPVLEQVLYKDGQRGHLHIARFCLEKAIATRTCHFPDRWKKELEQINQELTHGPGSLISPVPLVIPFLTAAVT